MSIPIISDESLVRLAVEHCRNQTIGKSPRWYCVSATFNVGQAYAKDLCRRFNLNPDEMMTR